MPDTEGSQIGLGFDRWELGLDAGGSGYGVLAHSKKQRRLGVIAAVVGTGGSRGVASRGQAVERSRSEDGARAGSDHGYNTETDLAAGN